MVIRQGEIPMFERVIKKLRTMRLWNLLWISLIVSEVMTGVMNSIIGLLWWGRIDLDLLLIGAIDAFIVALVATVILILIFNAMKEYERGAEEALRDKNAQLLSLINTMPDMVIFKDVTGRHVIVNKAVEEVTGHNADEITGKTIEDLLSPDPAAACRKSDESAMRRSEPTHAEERILRRDGSVSYFDMVKAPMVDDRGNVIGLIGVGRDITESKKAEDALRESEVRFRSIFNSTLDGIAIADTTTRKFIMGNRTMCTLLGCTAEELRTLAPEDIHPADALPQMRKHLEETARGEISISQNMPVKRKDGSIFYADISASIVILNGTMHFIGVFRDVTEQKRSSEEQHKLVSIIESSSDMIGIADLEGRLLYMNSAGLKLAGIDSFEDVRNKSVRDFHFEADYRKFEGHILPSILKTGSWTGEVTYRHFKTGAEVPVDMNGFLIRDDITGQPIALANISRDIADRKHTEVEKQKLQAQLLQAQKMEAIGQLAGGVAHDFNNILTAIIGYGSILQMKMTASDQLRINVDHIIESAGRAAQLTHSLLAFSRKQVMNMNPIHLNGIIARQELFLRRIIGEDIELKSILRGDAVIMADTGQLEQVLMNLATNARDAMPTGGQLTIETDMMEMTGAFINAHGFGETGTYAVISVTDSGSGMDEETKQKIFEPFFTTKEVGRGTGLGMAIVYGIVKQHKGFIIVYSQVGTGTTFKIYLPVHGEQVEPRAISIAASPVMTGTETILLAEDDATLRTFFKNILTEHGYTVVVAENGEEAIRKFLEQKDEIQLCVVDMIMPKKSGKDVYEAVQKMKPGIKVIFSSGYTADKVLQEGLPVGSTFIAKPAPPQDYLNKIREVLDGYLTQ
jgi:PAS domain S-box-containing protein